MQRQLLFLIIAFAFLAGSCGGSDSSAQESTPAPIETSSTAALTTSTTVPPTSTTKAPTEPGSLASLNWSRVPDVEAILGGPGNQGMASVTAGETGLVAVGQDGRDGDFDATVWTSPDGITWARVPHDEAIFGGAGDQVMFGLTVVGPQVVAVGREVSGGTSVAAVWIATTED